MPRESSHYPSGKVVRRRLGIDAASRTSSLASLSMIYARHPSKTCPLYIEIIDVFAYFIMDFLQGKFMA
jgi:hypothetical protein